MRRPHCPHRPPLLACAWPVMSAGPIPVLIAGLIALALPGCATSPGPARTGSAASLPAAEQQRRSEFDQSLDAWNGATVQELVRKLGKPEAINLGREGTLEYQYSKAGRPSADKRAFSCTVRYVIEGGTLKVIGHAIQGC